MRDDLPHAMRETARRLDPDVARLTAGGVSRGTRLRRVERVVQVLGSVVAVGVVFAGVVVFGTHRGEATGIGQAGPGGTDQSPATGVESVTPTSPPPTPTATATTSIQSGMAPLSDGDLQATLKSSLSGTDVAGTSFVSNIGEVIQGSPIMVAAQLSAPRGVGFIQIVFSGPRGASVPPGTSQSRPDGSVAHVYEVPAPSGGRSTLEVTLVRTDGSNLSAIETNSGSPKSAAAPGAPLLLTSDQVVTLLDSSAWDAAAAAADAADAVDQGSATPSGGLGSPAGSSPNGAP